LTGVLFLAGGFLAAFAGTAVAAGFFDGWVGFVFVGTLFCFFLGSSFLIGISFLGAESELELVLDTRVRFTFF
jgi:hypothetical protein